MQTWNYLPGRKDFVSDETIPSSDSIVKTKNVLMGRDLKNASSSVHANDMVISSGQAIENHCFEELNHQDLRFPDNSVREALISQVNGEKLTNPLLVNTNVFSLESNSRDSSFIDLKLGRLGDPVEVDGSGISKGAFVTKRIRAGANSNAVHCQVYRCNKDLSNSKEYHRRHKVCEDHSKTSKVIVKGIEQRFCQQCSRFHLLAEFDDYKRSCRKRLAGHNERRRKPKVSRTLPGKTGKLLQSYNVIATNRCHGTALASFICQDILPAGTVHPQNYGLSNWSSRHVKVEPGSEFCPPLSIPISSAHLHSKSLFPFRNLDKSLPSFHGNEAISATRRIFSGSSNRYPHHLEGSCSQSLFHDTSLGNEHFAGITNTVCALSLLSSQSHNLSSHSSGISLTSPFALVPDSSTPYSLSQASEKLMGVSSQFSTANVTNKFSSSGKSSAEGGGLSSILLTDGSDATNVDIADGIYGGSKFVDARDRFP